MTRLRFPSRFGWIAACILVLLIGIMGDRTDAEAAAPTKTPSQSDILAQYNLPREQTLVLLGSESNNARSYDPATGSSNYLLYSGLVSFNPSMQVVPELAEHWDLDSTRTLYTFHLRKNATFHNGKAVTARDVIYSWERAAAPATRSSTAMTYLRDIVGVPDKNSGKQDHIEGLTLIDDYTLSVRIDAPKPYFLMKLTYGPALIIDKDTVESGPDWYRKPNGTGPYKLIRWTPNEVQIYERYDGFYLPQPVIHYILFRLFAGVGVRLYESNQIDVTGVGVVDLDRVSDPEAPLHQDLIQQVSTCTSYVRIDVTQPPFDDLKVRQAFAHAINRQQYIDIGLRGHGTPAKGLYPPALPGYNLQLHDLGYDPVLAKKLLSESKYASALPTIVLTTGGFGGSLSATLKTLLGMWQNTLGISIRVEKLESDRYTDQIRQGYHGQLTLAGWCADYPDPENFADVLFHSNRPENWGHYANPVLDALLDQAGSEPDVSKRIRMYQAAEQLLVDDGAAIFLVHAQDSVLVKPYIKNYVLTPFSIPLERYLAIDSSVARHEGKAILP